MTFKEAGLKGALAKRQKYVDLYYSNPNTCCNCKKIIEIKDGERPSQVKVKKFCDHACSAAFNNHLKPKIKRNPRSICIRCGKSVNARNAKKFCSWDCYSIDRRELALKNPCHDMMRTELIRKYGAKCQKCGWAEINPVSGRCPIILNHIDGNSSNMKEYNLELLCPNCDSLTPTYKALNRGNGRRSRMLRYRDGKSY